MAKNNAINLAAESLTLDPGASGDSFVQFDINAISEFKLGVDDDDSDKFKISQGSTLGSSDTFIITANGERTMPLQPSFLATHTAAQNNVTGAGTLVTVAYTTEVHDQGTDYVPNTFTAPVTGNYNFSCSVLLDDVAANAVLLFSLRSTSFPTAITNWAGKIDAIRESTGDTLLVSTTVYNFRATAGDTVSVDVRISGMGGDTVDFPADAQSSYFHGALDS